MRYSYQLVSIGDQSKLIDDVIETLHQKVSELGLKKEAVLILNDANFGTDYRANLPTFVIYFSNSKSDFKHQKILEKLIDDANLVLPLVEDTRQFLQYTPDELHNINGAQLSDKNDIEKVVSIILEGLGLLRLSRRIFISYKRDESTGVAIQLYEELERNGFDVFLDTHSIRPGEPFQDELWHRMADTDVVVLLNTPKFLESHWTTQELAQANAMSIGILQLIWPAHKLEREAEICLPHQLSNNDFVGTSSINSKSYLKKVAVKSIASEVESLRARSLGARQDNIVSEFMTVADKLGKKAHLQPEKFITLESDLGKELIIIPTVGVPQAFTYYRTDEFYNKILDDTKREVYLLYDHLNIRERWLNHLSWLDTHLPIKTIKVTEVEQWLRNC